MSLLNLPSFQYSAPTTVWFAPDALGRLASYMKKLGVARGLVVCDPIVESSGIAAQVIGASEGRAIAMWSGVEPDAPRASLQRGAEEARKVKADGILAVGGGSAIDSAKAIALLARHGGDVARWDGVNKVGSPGLALIAIPTTAGTGSEASCIAVVKDAERGRKLVIYDRSIYPAVAILDPRLTTGLPKNLTAATGIDALTHAIEGMVSTSANPITAAIGLECVHLVRVHLPRAVAAPEDLEARGRMLLAASMAGQLVSMCFVGVAHSIAHALGVAWGVHHGTGNAIALPWSIRFNAGNLASATTYARCAEAFGLVRGERSDEVVALHFADAIEHLVAELGLPTRLSGVGLTEGDLDRLADLAFADPSHDQNPVKVTSAAEIRKSLKALL